ncbi:gamma-aminobutyraldehyde dehydrogenase [Saccharopolyspora subtropica]|uniref:Gamma-aminobutyraldehyde dehydrogenase n=1 Tax=Saccharopolyspora thermophila TaxID=89367 RepID=A0A917K3H3_9PSEU|nr:gamma-aminobutyraldehyde dehydrogenase [Saccharopolyspora subtropica]GGI98653.1 gamma-aminobutyraldehyde dehydrogenase [Saccharopolyspora subtropica]
MTSTGQHFINGKRRSGSSEERFSVTNPATGEVLAVDTRASADDVDEAVQAARKAFTTWSRTPPAERCDAMLRWADLLQQRSDELAATESSNGGKPIKLARGFDVPGVIDNVRFFAGAARNLEGKSSGEYSPEHTSTIRREPLGVVGSIAPWNYPLQMAAWKILPAVAAGNTIVLKPAELTPLTSVMFAEAAQEAGIPDGVINIVTGSGRGAGHALISHPNIAMVSFTGSTAVGREVAKTAAGQVKRVHLELGGKAPFVVFDDADLEAAARGAVAGALINSGQDCTAATRAYVQRPHYEAFVHRVAELMTDVRLGPVDDPDTDMGSLISFRQREHVAGMVERARAGGAKVVCGGYLPDGPLARGAYYAPTLIIDAPQDSEIVQQEIFGPVLVCLPFDTDDEAIRLANDTPYGLAASAWTSNVFRAQRASREIQAGCVWINDHIPIISEMPHGGYKASGFGKDMSTYSFDEYTNIKHVMSDITGDQRKSWHNLVFTSR